MWTFDEAVLKVEERLAILNIGQKEYELQLDRTEEWEGGWIFHSVPVDGNGYRRRFLVEKNLERVLTVGSAGVNRAIQNCYIHNHRF